MYGSRSFIELSVGNSHTVEVIVNIRECDLFWWNEMLEGHEKELFKLIQCHILPSEFHEEIYSYHKQRQDDGITKKNIIGEKNKKKRKANTKNDNTNNNNNNKSKKKAQSRSHETLNKVDEGTASKRKYDLDVSYLFGETLQITYKMEEIPVSSSATIMYHPTAIFKETSKENDKEDNDIKSSETLTFPVTFPAISAFSAITLPSTTDVSPQATLEEEERSPITLPSNLTFPEVFKFPFNTLPSPIMLFDPLELSTIGMFS